MLFERFDPATVIQGISTVIIQVLINLNIVKISMPLKAT